ncbi:MAG TPA: amidase, partial [Longimicrobiales bacterium]|nr:amidase [Longimicrobiales bacterium]
MPDTRSSGSDGAHGDDGARDGFSRRTFIKVAAAGGALAAANPLALASCESTGGGTRVSHAFPHSELEGLTLGELQVGLQKGRWSSRELTQAYLDRIQAIDRSGPTLKSVIEINPEALAIADGLDQERKAGKLRGPLHGIPVMVKDNIDSGDRMMTTAGSLALAGPPAPADAFVLKRLRQAGVVLLGKTNLSEWANFRGYQSSSGWSGRGGQCRNPYVLDRTPCGSSSGSAAAVAASLCAAAVGTETDGSVVCPSSVNSVVGVKPTLGLVSRSGIVPISHSQDTAGPMARTVTDAAILLSAMAGIDPNDPAAAARGHVQTDYASFLDKGALKGARLGLIRHRLMGYSPETDKLAEEAVAALKDAGAVVIDDLAIPHYGEYGRDENTVLNYEFKHDLNAYLATRPNAPIHSLADAIQFNKDHADEELRWFGQEIFINAEATTGLDDPKYKEALEREKRLSGPEGIDALMNEHRLNALIAPTKCP